VTPSRTALSVVDVTDRRLTCLGAAVKFSKKNNLLGVFVDAAVLVSLGNNVAVGCFVPDSGLRRFKFPH